MDKIINTPSKFAIEAAKKIATTLQDPCAGDESAPCWELLIQKAIDDAIIHSRCEQVGSCSVCGNCAWKPTLQANNLEVCQYCIMDKEIAQLRLDLVKSRQNADGILRQWKELAALLDKTLHHIVELIPDSGGVICATRCAKDCIRCAWEQMKETK